jgi:phage-related protein
MAETASLSDVTNVVGGEVNRIIGDPLSTECINFPNVSDITDIFPSFESLHALFTNVFKIPPELLAELDLLFPPTNLIPKIPNLPSLPDMDCLFGSIQMPSMAGAYTAVGVLSGQLMNVLNMILEKLKIFISLIPLPKFPIFGFTLKDFLKMDPVALIKKVLEKALEQLEQMILEAVGEVLDQYLAIKAAIEQSIEVFKTVYAKYSGSLKEFWEKIKLDGLPPLMPPLFVGFDEPLVEAITSVMGIGIAYIGMLIKNVTDNVKKFLKYLDDLEIDYPSFPSLPEIPSFTEILDMIKGQLSEMAQKAKEAAGELVDEANSFLNEKLNQTKELIDNMKDQIIKYGMAEIGKFMEMFNEAAANLRAIIDAIRNLKIPNFDIIIPNPLFPTLDIPLVEMVYSYYTMVLQMFSAVIKKITDYVKSLPLVGEILAKALPMIKDWLGAIPSLPSICSLGIQEKMDAAIASAKDGIQGTVSGAAGGIESFKDNATFQISSLNSQRESLGKEIQGGVDGAAAAAQGAMDKISDLASSACSTLNQGLGGLSDSLASKLNDFTDQLDFAIDDTLDGALDEVTDQVDGVNEFFAKSSENLDTLLNTLDTSDIIGVYVV